MADSITQTGVGLVQPTGAGDISFSTAVRRLVMRCDVGDADDSQAVDDTGALYTATVRSRPFFLAGIMNKHGVMAGALLAKAVAAGKVLARLVRDFGDERKEISVALDPQASEDTVIAPLDNLALSEMGGVQVEFEDDPDAPDTEWELHLFGLKPRKEQTS